MDWSVLEIIPHHTRLPEETASLWRATFLQRGFCLPATLHKWKCLLDEAPQSMSPTLFVDMSLEDSHQLQQVYRFPKLEVPLLPDEPELSQVLVSALNTPIPNLLTQSQIASEIVCTAQGAQVIVLLIMDGLAYEDILAWQYPTLWQWTRRPCLVDGVTLTTTCMPRVVGSPPLAHRLFQRGYKQHIGFTYWERASNDLTDILFAEFSSNQLMRVNEFAQILERLAATKFDAPTYIQIVRNGLDQLVHNHRERPDIHHYMQNLEKSVQNLLNLLTTFRRTVRVYITADHGILWYEGQNMTAIIDNPSSARYVTGNIAMSEGRFSTINESSASYTVAVGQDQILRRRRANEWGFHGGISGRESLVPFVMLEYRPQEGEHA